MTHRRILNDLKTRLWYSETLDLFDAVNLQMEIKLPKNAVVDDLDEVEPDEGTEDNNEVSEPVKRGPGRPKGSGTGTTKSTKTSAFHAITLTKRGIPKRIIVTHVMGKYVRAVSASNQNMEPVRLLISNVRHFDEDTFENLNSRGEKINNAVDQNFGLFNQLKALNAPKRGPSLKVSDPAEEL